jgi:hypothetical protein
MYEEVMRHLSTCPLHVLNDVRRYLDDKSFFMLTHASPSVCYLEEDPATKLDHTSSTLKQRIQDPCSVVLQVPIPSQLRSIHKALPPKLPCHTCIRLRTKNRFSNHSRDLYFRTGCSSLRVGCNQLLFTRSRQCLEYWKRSCC